MRTTKVDLVGEDHVEIRLKVEKHLNLRADRSPRHPRSRQAMVYTHKGADGTTTWRRIDPNSDSWRRTMEE